MASEEHGFALPQSLSTLALERFDELRSIGKLIYGPSTPEVVQHDGFTVHTKHKGLKAVLEALQH